MNSEIAYQTMDLIPMDMRPANWLTAFGYSHGRVRSGPLNHPLTKTTLIKLRSELAMWDSKAKAAILAQAKRSEGEATMSFSDLKKAAMTLPLNSFLRGLILAEPDHLPFQQGIAKIQVFSRLLYRELENS